MVNELSELPSYLLYMYNGIQTEIKISGGVIIKSLGTTALENTRFEALWAQGYVNGCALVFILSQGE